MSDLLGILQEADAASFEMERSKEAVESAKVILDLAKEKFEQAKVAFDQTLSQADQLGVPRAKMRKLVEERTLALMASGLMPSADARSASALKVPKLKKQKAIETEKSETTDSAEERELEPIQMDI